MTPSFGVMIRGGRPACTPVSGPHSGLKGGGGGGFTTPARRNSACKSEDQNSHTCSSVRPGTGRQARSPVSASMRMVRNTHDERVGERPGIYHVSVVSPHRETSRSPVAVHTVSRVMFKPSCWAGTRSLNGPVSEASAYAMSANKGAATSPPTSSGFGVLSKFPTQTTST